MPRAPPSDPSKPNIATPADIFPHLRVINEIIIKAKKGNRGMAQANLAIPVKGR